MLGLAPANSLNLKGCDMAEGHGIVGGDAFDPSLSETSHAGGDGNDSEALRSASVAHSLYVARAISGAQLPEPEEYALVCVCPRA